MVAAHASGSRPTARSRTPTTVWSSETFSAGVSTSVAAVINCCTISLCSGAGSSVFGGRRWRRRRQRQIVARPDRPRRAVRR